MEKKDKLITIVSIVIIVVSAVFIANRVIATIYIGDTINMQTNILTDLADPSNPLDAATKEYVDSQSGAWELSAPNLYPELTTYNVAIGTFNAQGDKLRVEGGIINAVDGLRIENRTNDVPPAERTAGRIWICTDNDGTPYDCIAN